MASNKKKKTLSKDELRLLMKQTKASTKTKSKTIDHPLAKYNSLDQLVCVMCNCVIKSDLMWPAHVQSRAHKEKSSIIKTETSTVGVKRKATDVPPVISQKLQKDEKGKPVSNLPQGFSDSKSKNNSISVTKNNVLGNSLAAYSDSSSSEDEDPSTESKPVASGLPPGFFDKDARPAEPEEETKEEEPKPKTMAEALPEGFFDDPKIDAKVRKVEYVDKMEEEWDLFQKAVKQESKVSEAIMEEEDVQVNVERNIDEIDEQINRWKEINELQDKKEKIINTNIKKCAESDSEDLDEGDLAGFLDWRSKKVL